jgi:hypothetical protein
MATANVCGNGTGTISRRASGWHGGLNHHRTVVRAGFGIFYGNPYNREVIQTQRLGFGGVASYRTPVPFTLREGLPPGALQFPEAADLKPEFGAIGTRWPQQQVTFINPERSTNYSQNFNLSIGQQVKEIAFEFGYPGQSRTPRTVPGHQSQSHPGRSALAYRNPGALAAALSAVSRRRGAGANPLAQLGHLELSRLRLQIGKAHGVGLQLAGDLHALEVD